MDINKTRSHMSELQPSAPKLQGKLHILLLFLLPLLLLLLLFSLSQKVIREELPQLSGARALSEINLER